MPYSIKKDNWSRCSSITFCDLNENLYGQLVGIKYLHRINRKDNGNFDIDFSIIQGRQSPIITSTKKIKSYKGGVNRDFAILSIVPSYRYYFGKKSKSYNIGIGTGLNYSINKFPSETIEGNKLNAQINLELGYALSKARDTDIILNLQHRCSLFGLINGKISGRQWYTIGIRKWY